MEFYDVKINVLSAHGEIAQGRNQPPCPSVLGGILTAGQDVLGPKTTLNLVPHTHHPQTTLANV